MLDEATKTLFTEIYWQRMNDAHAHANHVKDVALALGIGEAKADELATAKQRHCHDRAWYFHCVDKDNTELIEQWVDTGWYDAVTPGGTLG